MTTGTANSGVKYSFLPDRSYNFLKMKYNTTVPTNDSIMWILIN